MKNLILLADSGITRIICELVGISNSFCIEAIYDDNLQKTGKTYNTFIIKGPISKAFEADKSVAIFNCLGNFKYFKHRVELSNKIVGSGYFQPIFIHPTAHISKSSQIEQGTLICPHVVINTNSKIGRNNIIFSGSVIEHDSIVEDNCYISPNVTICGKVTIRENSYVGPGAIITAGITIGKNCIIGSGANILNSVPDNSLLYGNPGIIIKNLI